MRKKRILTEEHKRKVSEALKGRKRTLTAEWKENLRIAGEKRRGKCFNPPMSEHQKQRIREVNSKPKTEEHKRKIAETLKGRKNPDHSKRMKERMAKYGNPNKGKKTGKIPWNKGKKYAKSTLRSSTLSREWAKKVKERDGWKCTKCGSQKNLHAHHIVPWKEKKELRFDVNNGITVCNSCHAKIEGFQKGHGHKKSNRWLIA